MENINSWKDHSMERPLKELSSAFNCVFLKQRKNKEFEKMYKIQKLLISSKSAKYLSTRKVTQDNTGKKTPGVDKILIKTTPSERFA
jgi:RNA-directed DNA polymerase